MRLVCPNCDAEYEVDSSVIPLAGRDVQCSNCGHTWFQNAPEVEAAAAEEAALFDPAPPIASPVASPVAAPAQPEAPPSPVRRSIDESVLAVLREEAEREVKARKAEPEVVEVQPDLGLRQGGEAALAERIARLKAEQQEPEVETPRVQNRKELLPAIEEINSSLRASNERRGGEAGAVAESLSAATRERAGFRSGFVLMIVLAVVLGLAYVMAPKLAEQIPGAAPALNAYVDAVNAARLWVDGLMQWAIGAMRGSKGG